MAWPVERAVYLAPVIVVGVAAVVGLVILWGKIACGVAPGEPPAEARARALARRHRADRAPDGARRRAAARGLGSDHSFEWSRRRRPTPIRSPRLRLYRFSRRCGVKRVAFTAALVVAAVVVAAPAGARQATQAPGTWCGGTLWKLMTLSDTGKSAVNWTPAQTGIADIAKMTAPTRILASRNNTFEKQTVAGDGRGRALSHPVERRDRARDERHSHVDVHECVHAQPALPVEEHSRPHGHPRGAHRVHDGVRRPAPTWKTLGATVTISGVGFWNPVKTTMGALGNGAERRPVTSFSCSRGAGSSEPLKEHPAGAGAPEV